MITVPAIDYSDNNIQVTYDDTKSFGEGGEGKLYFTADKQEVVKIYKSGINKKYDAIRKILSLHPNKGNNGEVGQYLAWPTAMILDQHHPNRVAGITMPNATHKTWMKDLDWYYNSKTLQVLPVHERGSLRGIIQIALQIAAAVRYLNFTGFAHGDLNPKNILGNPVEGRAIIIDLDGLVVPDFLESTVLGMPRFMAPELEMREKDQQDRLSDRHALAVNLYHLLCLAHPLLGGGRPSLASDANEDDHLQLGANALYREHPTDLSNRPKGDYISATFFGNDIKELFEQAFVHGLFYPSQRPSPSDWESALKKLLGDLNTCRNPDCLWHEFPSLNGAASKCPMCGTVAPPPPSLGTMHIFQESTRGFYANKSARTRSIPYSGSVTFSDVFGANNQSDRILLQIEAQTKGWKVTLREPNFQLLCLERDEIKDFSDGQSHHVELDSPLFIGKKDKRDYMILLKGLPNAATR